VTGFLIVIAMLGLSSFGIFSTVRRLRRCRVGRSWWRAFGVLSLVGVVGGWWLAFHLEYQPSARVRFVSFPMPVAFFHLEDGQWVDFVTPWYVMYPGLVANIVATTALTVLPLLVISVVVGRKNDRGEMES
jgi:hypothetical protein